MELTVRGSPCTNLRSKARWLVALLLLRRGQPVERPALAAQLWPDSLETRSLYNLRRELSALRRALGDQADRLVGSAGRTIAFDATDCNVDVATFDECIEHGGDDELARAVDLYRGPLLEGCREEWVLPLRDARRSACAAALERLVTAAFERTDLGAAEDLLERLLALDPLRESAHRLRIRMLARRCEFAGAVQAYRDLRLLLRREVGVAPDAETTALYDRVRAEARRRAGTSHGERAGLPLPGSRPHPPMPLTRLVGRGPQLARLQRLLAGQRLVTLTGPAGVGKTRLALEIASELDARFDDGIAWLELAALTDAVQLADTLANALGVRSRPGRSAADAVSDYLRGRQLLLVIDNCEHLPAIADLAGELLRGHPQLRILATSRQSLGLRGETIVQVPPLALPGTDVDRERDAASRSAALSLLIERMAQARPDFDVDDGTIGPAIEICRRLEGIPLCLELAAARVRTLTVAEMLRRLDDVMADRGARRLQTAHRHETFRAALDWSHDLLSVDEQTLLRRLAVFAGGCSLEAAEAVCPGDGIEPADVLGLLETLIDGSLVVRDEASADQSRYRLLEPVRQYAETRLHEAGERRHLRQRHLAHFARLAEAAAPHLFGGGQDTDWPRLLDLDLDNLRTALGAAQEQPQLAADVVRLGTALQWYWFANGNFRAGRRHLADALDLARELPRHDRARALVALAYLAFWEGDLEAMDAPLAESLAIHRRLGDRWGEAYAGSMLAYREGTRGAPSAVAAMDEAVAAARESGDRTLTSIALWWRGMLHQQRGDLRAARASFEEVLQTIRALNHATGIGHALYPLARLALAEGDLDEAQRLFDESVTTLGSVGNDWGVSEAISGLVEVAAVRRDFDDVARLVGALEVRRERLGGGLSASERDQLQKLVAAARTAIGEADWQAQWAAGRTLSWRDIVRREPA